MAQTNVRKPSSYSTRKTHEGAVAKNLTPIQEFRRSVMSTFLWEDEFYESGQSISERIKKLIPLIDPNDLSKMVVEIRQDWKLIHMPLFILKEMLKYPQHKKNVGVLLEKVIWRAKEIKEFMAMYLMDEINFDKIRYLSGKYYDSEFRNYSEFESYMERQIQKKPIANQVKKGLSLAFNKFNEYQLAKYNTPGKLFSLKDVMCLVHPKPKTNRSGYNKEFRRMNGMLPFDKLSEQEKMYKKLLDGLLTPAETWENITSDVTKDPKAEFEYLLKNNKMGSIAILRNLRQMISKGVDERIIREAMKNMDVEKVLPFRFITASKYVPMFEDALEDAMFRCISKYEKLKGRTVILIDISGSMNDPLSNKQTRNYKNNNQIKSNRLDAALSLAIICREICEECAVYSFSNALVSIKPRRGFALADEINKSQHHLQTYLGKAIKGIEEIYKYSKYDRLIVFTDEQSHDRVPSPSIGKGYMINVASYQNSVAYYPWHSITGMSEKIIDYIQEYEKEFE